ncbi:MAG: hypothetical protein H0T71_03730 [Acidobacteria bacterium]|nr:hypothetical protein [Acidobacteriota bacterium]
MPTRALVLSLLVHVVVAADQAGGPAALTTVLQRAGERVERYFARAQSLVCLEVMKLQPLTPGWASEGFGRTVESELRLAWAPGSDGVPSAQAQTLRQVLRVNGHPPRKNDWNNCTTPEQESEEVQPISLLLPGNRSDYRFTSSGSTRFDGRAAISVDYELLKEAQVDVHMVEGRDDCVSFNLEGGLRGRILIDAETYDVLRLDQRLSGMVEIPLPKTATRRSGGPGSWTMERWDTSIRFKPVSFLNPDETLVLPVSTTSIRITRGSGTPRLRTSTDYKHYQRFLTGARIVGD